MLVAIAAGCSVPDDAANGGARRISMHVPFRGPMAKVDAAAGERVRAGIGAGRASARPDVLLPAARRYLVSTTLASA